MNQTRPPDEIIIVEDNSDELTEADVQYLRDLASRPMFKIINNTLQLGVAGSMNRGAFHASGDYLFFLAADDTVEPDFLATAEACLNRYHSNLFFCRSRWSTDDGLSWVAGKALPWTGYVNPHEMANRAVANNLMLVSHTMVIKRDLFVKAGGYYGSTEWHCDWLLSHIAAFMDGFAESPAVLTKARIHDNSYSAVGMRSAEHAKVLDNLVTILLHTPTFGPLLPLFKSSGVLGDFGLAILRPLRKYDKSFINRPLLIRAGRRQLEMLGRRWLPRSFARWLLRNRQ